MARLRARRFRRGTAQALLLVALVALVAGCTADEGEPLGTPCSEVDGVGLPAAPVCDGTVCTAGVSCTTVVEVGSDAELAAASTAEAGACFALLPGDYGDVELAAGVSLLGRGADHVRVRSVTVDGGTGATIRGVHVAGGGVSLTAAKQAELDRVCVSGAEASGVDVGAASSATLRNSHVHAATHYGVRAFDAEAVALVSTLVTAAGAPALWAQCTAGCACASQPVVTLDGVAAHGNALVGIALHGVKATLSNVDIRDTERLDFEGGSGLSIAACSDVTAEGLSVRILGSSALEAYGAFGVLVDSARGVLGAPGEEKGMIIVGGRPGLWVMDSDGTGLPVELTNFEVQQSTGIGLGASAEARGMIIVGGKVDDTAATTLPLASGGAGEVGDGLLWSGLAQIVIDGLSLSGSARRSVLIDGPVAAGSSIANLSQAGGDEATGVLQQGVQAGATAPAVGAGAPALTTSAEQAFGVAEPPASPSAL